ncbi:alpha/beta hydrolase, partial [Streptomyces hyaluromycini]
MAQQATPARTASLSRAVGQEPTTATGAVLLLPGGEEVSARKPSLVWATALVRAL